MLSFDRKIDKQIKLYYLSKIFFNFKNVIEKETKKDNQKAYKFYFRNLKKRVFDRFVEACFIGKHEKRLN